MQYILYSPSHKVSIPEIRKLDGEVIPQRTVIQSPRALYKLRRKYKMPDRRYRHPYPSYSVEMVLVKCKTLEEAKQEQNALRDYCGETFEIHEYKYGEIGDKVE